MTMKGCCNCGSIKIDIKGVPSNHEKRPTRYCHCTTCRRASSGPGQYLLSIDEDLVEISDPQGLKKSWKDTSTNSGTPADRLFCGSCGTPLYATTPNRPGKIIVMAGVFDTIDQVVTEEFTKTMYFWEPTIKSAEQFDAGSKTT